MKNQVPKPLLDYPKLGDWLKVTPEKKLLFFHPNNEYLIER